MYTLRLAVQPDTGDHTDTAPHQDFALLVPAKADDTADALEVKAVVKLSLKATGGDHPGVGMNLDERDVRIGGNVDGLDRCDTHGRREYRCPVAEDRGFSRPECR